jgi:hypothetical protein
VHSVLLINPACTLVRARGVFYKNTPYSVTATTGKKMSPRTPHAPQPRTIEVRLRRGRKHPIIIREYTIPPTVNGQYVFNCIANDPDNPNVVGYLASFGYTERVGRPGRWKLSAPVLPIAQGACDDGLLVDPDEPIDAWSDEEAAAAAHAAALPLSPPPRDTRVPRNVLREVN